MKRHISLEAFSRDHNDGLVLARRILSSTQAGYLQKQYVASWEAELYDHFSEEERLLQPIIREEDRQRLWDDHVELREQVDRLRANRVELIDLQVMAQSLVDHIRWEERYLFPEIQRNSTAEQLHAIERETRKMEIRRHSFDPKRGELVRERWRRMASQTES